MFSQHNSRDAIDDAISEYGWAAVREGLHSLGREPMEAEIAAANKKHGRHYNKAALGEECVHVWVGVEPPFDFCIACGTPRKGRD